MKAIVVSLLIAIGFSVPHGETHLAGEILSATIDASGNPYFVDKDISVAAGKKLTIKEGCVFLFNNFSGLTVLGNLQLDGTLEHPVIFSCVNDAEYNPKSQQIPNPFDWNGIIITKESGSVHLQNFQLRYSVYGIKSQNASMSIQNGIFRQNGQFHFTLNDKIQYVQDNISYSFNAAGESGIVAHGAWNGKKGKASVARNIIRYGSLAVGVAGIIGGIVYADKAQEKYKKLPNMTNYGDITSEQYTNQVNDFKNTETLRNVFFVVGGVGVTGFALTFFF
jgi:hypothetical protein